MLITSSVSPPLSPALPSSAGHSHHNHFTSALQPPPPPSENIGGNSGGVLPLSQPPNRGGTLTIFPPTSARLISHKYEDGLATPNNSVLASNTVPVISRVTNQTESSYHKSSAAGNKAPAAVHLQQPSPAASSSLPLRGSDNYADCVTLPPLTGHPREGQAASLLGGKYLLLEEIEGASLHRCLHIQSNQEFICKVRNTSDMAVAAIKGIVSLKSIKPNTS